MSRDDVPRPKLLPHTGPDALQTALDMFLIAKQAERSTPATLRSYRWLLAGFVRWLHEQNVTAPAAITAHHIRAYTVKRQADGVGDNTLRTTARTIKTWLRFLAAEELIPATTAQRVPLPRVDDRILPAFSPDDVRRLLRYANERTAAIVLVLLDSGCRASEFCALTAGDLDTRTGELRIRQGKGGKQRIVYLGARTRKALLKLRIRGELPDDPRAPLFPRQNDGKHLAVSGLQTLLLRLGERAGVDHVNPHTFRRTFALWSLRAGMDVYSLSRLMGHRDLSMLRRYLALVQADLQQAHEQHGAVDSWLD